MTSRKADSRFTPRYDCPDFWPSEESDDDSYFAHQDPDKARSRWVEEHFDVLQDLYNTFTQSGKYAFGRTFYQFGGFHTFCSHIYDSMELNRPPLTSD